MFWSYVYPPFFYYIAASVGNLGGGKDILSYRILSCYFLLLLSRTAMMGGFTKSGSLLIKKECLDVRGGLEYGIWIWDGMTGMTGMVGMERLS